MTHVHSLFFVVFVVFVFHGSALAYDPVVPNQALEFPRDRGAHPGHRIEWWYVTGHVDSPQGPMGFQVTFFRVRNPDAEKNPSRFSPKQLLFAHAAVADPAQGRLLHDQRSARLLEGLVEARVGETDVRIDDWALRREGGVYRARIASEEFALDLVLAPTQPPLAQGDGGFSRKGPNPAHASYYYSEPHLQADGHIRVKQRSMQVRGTAWLDHEWSSELLAADASGWDWVGANLDDGSALMAFRIRGKDGGVLWASATLRPGGGEPRSFQGGEVRLRPRRTWQSPRTGISYPVAMELQVGERAWSVEPLMDDQELDARASTGTLYWEGAVRLLPRGSHAGGRGYLELTGYAGRVPF